MRFAAHQVIQRVTATKTKKKAIEIALGSPSVVWNFSMAQSSSWLFSEATAAS